MCAFYGTEFLLHRLLNVRLCPDESLDAGSDSRETRFVVVVRSVVSIAAAAGVGRSLGSHGVGWTRIFLNVPCSVQEVLT